MLKSAINVAKATNTLGNRAANSPTPNTFMHSACIQKKSGGFSQKGSKFTVTCRKLPLTNISRADSAKFISSQSNKFTDPKKGKKRMQVPIKISQYGLNPLLTRFSWNYFLVHKTTFPRRSINHKQIHKRGYYNT